MRSLNIMGELFSGGKTVDIYDPVLTTGNTSTNPDDFAYNTRTAHGHNPSIKATISNAIFFVKALAKGELSIAFNAEDKIIYGELNHFSKGTASIPARTIISRFAVTMEADRRRIVYEGDAPDDGNPYAILPYVAAEVLFSENEELRKSLVDAVNFVHTGPRYTARSCAFKFCDAFYMCVKYEFEQILEVDEYENNLAVSSIKESYKMGYFQDLGNVNNAAGLSASAKLISEELKLPPCEAFSDIKKKARRKKATKKKETAEERWERVLKKIKSGDYVLNFDWLPEQLSKIVPMSYLDNFIPTEEFYALLDKIELRLNRHMVPATLCGETGPEAIAKDIVNVLLYGDPGSGKTSLVHALSAATGMPLYSIKFNEDSEDDVFEGKNKIVEGKISFVGTDFLEGFANGGIILMEEINLGRANMLTSVMNQAMEYPFYIEENGYKKVHRHPLVAAFATMNLDTDGTTTLNSAMAQRFANKYMIGEPTPEQFRNILKKDGFMETRIDFVYGVYDKIRSYLKDTSSRTKYLKEISIRQCKAALYDMEEAAEFASDGKLDAAHAKTAIFNSFYGALCIKSRKLADAVKESILDTYPDYVDE